MPTITTWVGFYSSLLAATPDRKREPSLSQQSRQEGVTCTESTCYFPPTKEREVNNRSDPAKKILEERFPGVIFRGNNITVGKEVTIEPGVTIDTTVNEHGISHNKIYLLGDTHIKGNTNIYGSATLSDSTLTGAFISGSIRVEKSTIEKGAFISGSGIRLGNSLIEGKISGDQIMVTDSTVTPSGHISGYNIRVKNSAIINSVLAGINLTVGGGSLE